jgi:hypothetical protein
LTDTERTLLRRLARGETELRDQTEIRVYDRLRRSGKGYVDLRSDRYGSITDKGRSALEREESRAA